MTCATPPAVRFRPDRYGLRTGGCRRRRARRFFYDVWGDAVNVASRMESTDPEGRIQVPQDVYERLRDRFELEERGDVEIKGKGVMHTWYLVGRKPLPDTVVDIPAGRESGRVETPTG